MSEHSILMGGMFGLGHGLMCAMVVDSGSTKVPLRGRGLGVA